MSVLSRLALVVLPVLLLCAPACKARKSYPDVLPGWHSPGYDVIFGRLQRVPSRDPREAPMWLIRYGLTNSTDPYRGELALKPAQMMTGYAGGELVEVRGELDPTFKSPDYTGTFYEVRAIRIWNGSTSR